jgi:hypothetical protein
LRTVQPEKRTSPAPVAVPCTVTPELKVTRVEAVTVPVEKAAVPLTVRVPAVLLSAPVRVAEPKFRVPEAVYVMPPASVPVPNVTVAPPDEVMRELTPVLEEPVVVKLDDKLRNVLAASEVVVLVSKKPPLTTSVAEPTGRVRAGTVNAAVMASVTVPKAGPAIITKSSKTRPDQTRTTANKQGEKIEETYSAARQERRQ